MDLELVMWSFLVSTMLWTGSGRGDRVMHLHAPCYNCQFYHMMQHDKAFHDRQVSLQCQTPCQCENEASYCTKGVKLVKDGCGCCMICVRQLNEVCDHRFKCDEGLNCDFSLDGGISGFCRKKPPMPCLVDGKLYKHGDNFKPSCRSLCICRDGKYGCVSLCPEEKTIPTNMHCPRPQLINVTGQCCKQWICPSITTTQRISSLSKQSLLHRKTTSNEHSTDALQRLKCSRRISDWTPCSVTCGMGVSTRVTYDDKCIPIHQRRLCFIRPCSTIFSEEFTSCRNSHKPEHAGHLLYGNCKSVNKYRPKYCSVCETAGCCVPHRTNTIPVEFVCHDGGHTVLNFMWIRSCLCGQTCAIPP